MLLEVLRIGLPSGPGVAAVAISGSPPMCPSVASSARPILWARRRVLDADVGCVCARLARTYSDAGPARPRLTVVSSSISPTPFSGVT